MTTPPADLGDGEVHLWLIPCATPHPAEFRMLSAAERAKAEGFRTEALRHAYVAAHAGTRRLLGRYTGIPPQWLTLQTGRWGKPWLGGGARWLRFNLSHSGSWTLLAVKRGGAVGVDIQRALRPAPLDAAAVIGTADEVVALRKHPDAAAAFYAFWTRKEALCKAIGSGLSNALQHLPVGADGPVLLRDQPGRRWWIDDLPPVEGYHAAVATSLLAPSLRLRHFEGAAERVPGLVAEPCG